MIINIDFRQQKITELFLENNVVLTSEVKEVLVDYYTNNYDRVRTNIVDDELVGYEYHNLCAIEEMEPKVKDLKMCCR